MRRRRLNSLPIFVRLRGVNVILLGDGEPADAKRRLLERAGAIIVGEDSTAALAIVAIEDEDEAQAAVARLKGRGILVNAVDRVALCDFTVPAIVDREPVLIAIGTGGASAGLAKALRQRLETILPAQLGQVAKALSKARPTLRARFPDGGDRRRAIDDALGEGGPLDVLGPSSAVDAWIAAPQTENSDRVATIVLASPDPDDLTIGQARLLGQADRVYVGGNVPTAIRNRVRADAAQIVGDAPVTAMRGLTVTLTMAPS